MSDNLCCHSLAYVLLFCNAAFFKTPVVNPFINILFCKHSVCDICPCFTPFYQLFVTVPAFVMRFCLPYLVLLGYFDTRSYPIISASDGVMYTFFLPTLYWYCFSQPDFCANLNSAAVKPFSSPLRLQRYSFSVLCCHFPFSFSGRTVKIICA